MISAATLDLGGVDLSVFVSFAHCIVNLMVNLEICFAWFIFWLLLNLMANVAYVPYNRTLMDLDSMSLG